MVTIQNYVRAKSLEEAYELNQKKGNCILGGMLWTKMQNRMIQTAIDLCDLGLNEIEETEEEFSIGAMVSLRQLETDARAECLYTGCSKRCGKGYSRCAVPQSCNGWRKHLGTIRIL